MQRIALKYASAIRASTLVTRSGRLRAIHGLVIEASGCEVHLGELVEVVANRGGNKVLAEVVGLKHDHFLLMPLSNVEGLCLSSRVNPLGRSITVPTGDALLGRVIDAVGQPLDGAGGTIGESPKSAKIPPINPLQRSPIRTLLNTGVNVVDLFVPIGRGQRLGIFAGSGVGKSTLLGMMAKSTDADVIVIALIGERGREVGDFIRDSLGENGLKRAIVVVATADQPAVLRRQAAYTATVIAESFRKSGKHVLLIMDSVTRLAMAQREIGLATGEPIGTRGYPSSAFAMLPPLLERAGAIEGEGSITAIYTVLVEGDDMNEPVTDHMRSILDGHIVLSRELAEQGHYPAVDVLQSISRLQSVLHSAEQKHVVEVLRKQLSVFSRSRDLVELGAYQAGANPDLDVAIKSKPLLDKLLRQSFMTGLSSQHAWQEAKAIVAKSSVGER